MPAHSVSMAVGGGLAVALPVARVDLARTEDRQTNDVIEGEEFLQ